MIKFYPKNDDEVFVGRKDDKTLGLIKRDGKGELMFTSVDSLTMSGVEMLIVAASLLSTEDYAEYLQELINEGFQLEIKAVDE